MATHSSVLAWRIPGIGEPGELPSMGSHRVRHNWSDLVVVVVAVVRIQGFPGSSTGKGSACSGGNASSISELGCSPGKGMGYPI